MNKINILKNHPIDNNKNIYRLFHINYNKLNRDYSKVEAFYSSFKPFMLPGGMSNKDSFKVLSYLTDYIERYLNLEECSYSSVELLNRAIDLKRLGFKRIEDTISDDNIIDLFTVIGKVEYFKYNDLYLKYFEWYTPNVSFDEVKKIYKDCGIDFYDLNIDTKINTNEKNIKKEKHLVRKLIKK